VYEEDESLGNWVYTQRRLFKTGKMDPERKMRLDEIGFGFDKADEENWNLQFKRLLDYYEKHGHCELFWTVNRFIFVLNTPTNTPPVSPLHCRQCATNVRGRPETGQLGLQAACLKKWQNGSGTKNEA
jgi:hypothetical protein